MFTLKKTTTVEIDLDDLRKLLQEMSHGQLENHIRDCQRRLAELTVVEATFDEGLESVVFGMTSIRTRTRCDLATAKNALDRKRKLIEGLSSACRLALRAGYRPWDECSLTLHDNAQAVLPDTDWTAYWWMWDGANNRLECFNPNVGNALAETLDEVPACHEAR